MSKCRAAIHNSRKMNVGFGEKRASGAKNGKQVVGAYIEPNIPIQKIHKGNTFLIINFISQKKYVRCYMEVSESVTKMVSYTLNDFNT